MFRMEGQAASDLTLSSAPQCPCPAPAPVALSCLGHLCFSFPVAPLLLTPASYPSSPLSTL